MKFNDVSQVGCCLFRILINPPIWISELLIAANLKEPNYRTVIVMVISSQNKIHLFIRSAQHLPTTRKTELPSKQKPVDILYVGHHFNTNLIIM